MVDMTTPLFWGAVGEIIFVNILLSGDNAVVIALACRNLSPRQRRYGIFWGVLGAIVLRVVLTFFVLGLLANPWLKVVGAVLLFWIGIRLIAEEEVEASDRLLVAVGTIMVADLVMSLDNVMAVAAAAKGNAWLVVLGLGISIPIVIMGSQIITPLLRRFPWLVYVGGGLLGYIAGEMTVEAVASWTGGFATGLETTVSLIAFAAVVAAGFLIVRRRKQAGPR